MTAEIAFVAACAMVIFALGVAFGRYSNRRECGREIASARSLYSDEIDDVLTDKIDIVRSKEAEISELKAEVFRLRGEMAAAGRS